MSVPSAPYCSAPARVPAAALAHACASDSRCSARAAPRFRSPIVASSMSPISASCWSMSVSFVFSAFARLVRALLERFVLLEADEAADDLEAVLRIGVDELRRLALLQQERRRERLRARGARSGRSTRSSASSFSVPGTCAQSPLPSSQTQRLWSRSACLRAAAAAHEVALPIGLELELDREPVQVLAR